MTADELGEAASRIEHGRDQFLAVSATLEDIRQREGWRIGGYKSFEDYLRRRWRVPIQAGYMDIRVCRLGISKRSELAKARAPANREAIAVRQHRLPDEREGGGAVDLAPVEGPTRP